MATKIRMKSNFSMSDCNTGKKLSQLTVKINARKGHMFRKPKPVSYHVDMHSIAKSHFDEAVSWGDVTQYVKVQSVSQLMNPGPRGTGNNKPSPNPGHPQEPVRKSGRDTLGAEQHASPLTGLTRGPHRSIQWHRLLQHFTVIWGNCMESFLERVHIMTMHHPLMHPIATTFVSLYLIHPSSMTVRGFKESKNKWFVMSWNARERLFLDNWVSTLNSRLDADYFHKLPSTWSRRMPGKI